MNLILVLELSREPENCIFNFWLQTTNRKLLCHPLSFLERSVSGKLTAQKYNAKSVGQPTGLLNFSSLNGLISNSKLQVQFFLPENLSIDVNCEGKEKDFKTYRCRADLIFENIFNFVAAKHKSQTNNPLSLDIFYFYQLMPNC